MSTQANTQARLSRIAPQLRPAGEHSDWTEATVAELLSSYKPDGVTTPEHIRSFHHRGCDVGERRRHWGQAKDDMGDDSGIRHGLVKKDAQDADACLRPAVYADKMTALLDAQRETQYLSNRRKPLGHAPTPRDPIPVPSGGFGVRNEKGDSTQSVLGGYRTVEVLHKAGEQLTRNYDWDGAGIDPIEQRFGMPSANANGSTAAALSSVSGTQLSSKLAKDYQSTVVKELAKSKSYGFDDPAEWDEAKRGRMAKPGATGKASSFFQTEQPTVGELLSSWAQSAAEDETTSGKRRKGGSQALATSSNSGVAVYSEVAATSGAATGALALKGDLRDDVHAHQLLYPCRYVSLGVESKYFAGGRTLADIRQLSHKCGFGLTDDAIDTVFAEVSQGRSTCSIEEFKNAARGGGYM